MTRSLFLVALLAGCIPSPESGQTVSEGTNNGAADMDGATNNGDPGDLGAQDSGGADATADMGTAPFKFYEHRIGLVLDTSSGWSNGSSVRQLANRLVVGFKADMVLGSPAELAGRDDLDLIMYPQAQSYNETSIGQLRLDEAPMMTMGVYALASLGLFDGTPTGSLDELSVTRLESHPALGGLDAGPYEFTTTPGFQTHTLHAPGAQIIAEVTGQPGLVALAAFEVGAELTDGSAAARRIFLPYRSFVTFTETGWHVFDHSAWWLLDVAPPPGATFQCHVVADLTAGEQDFRHVALRLQYEGCDVTFVRKSEVSTIGASDLIVVTQSADETGVGEVLREQSAPVVVFYDRSATVQDLGLVGETNTVETADNDWQLVTAPPYVLERIGEAPFSVGPGYTNHEAFASEAVGPQTSRVAVTTLDGLVTVMAIEAGATRADGGTAPARRIAVPSSLVNGLITDAGYSPTPAGVALIDAAVRWALGTL